MLQCFMTLSSFHLTCVIVFLILSTATITIFALQKWQPNKELFKKIQIIIKSWWWITGSFLLALAWERWGIILFMYLVTLFSLREYLKISKVPYKKYLFFVTAALCSLQYLLLSVGSFTYFLFVLPLLCIWIIPVLVIFYATVQQLELVTSVGIGLVLLVYYISHIPALAAFNQLNLLSEEFTFAIFILILVTWLNDVFQFIAGNMIGRRKIVPQISPNKTLGGFIGGVIGTTLLTVLAAPPLIHIDAMSALGLGIVVSVTGMLGDLFFSAVKRNIGVKDFSQALPGHGGLLDRLDSLIFTAPIYFHYL
ncbi:phosphatidate cytidylyltransferase, partial [bacterium]|nr:phosphatidate cytidylyltransferase [bacterium]